MRDRSEELRRPGDLTRRRHSQPCEAASIARPGADLRVTIAPLPLAPRPHPEPGHDIPQILAQQPWRKFHRKPAAKLIIGQQGMPGIPTPTKAIRSSFDKKRSKLQETRC
jgi:hypothetical protein